MRRPTPRAVHPAAWWVWAVGVAVAVSQTTNPLLLALALAVLGLVVASRRSSHPWARAFRLYLWLGLFIVAVRVVLHVLVGLKSGAHLLLPLPRLRLPGWAAGIELGGDVYLEGLVGAVLQGARLAVLIAAVGAANALANPKRLLRTLPGALHEIGTALVVAVSVAPALAESVLRVRRARELRGDTRRGLRSLASLALPVLEDTLDRSLVLAASMDARGYGRSSGTPRRRRHATAALTLGGLLAVALGTYGLLDATAPRPLGIPTLALGVGLAAAGLWLGGRDAGRTTHRPDPWGLPEWVTALSGLAAAGALLLTTRTDPLGLTQPLEPLVWPSLPLLAVGGLLVAALPAVATPEPARATRHTVRGGRPREVTRHA